MVENIEKKNEELNVEQISQEIQKDEQDKANKMKEEIRSDVKKDLDNSKELQELKLQFAESLKQQENLRLKLEEQTKKIEEIPTQRKGLINNDNPQTNNLQQFTERDFIELVDYLPNKQDMIKKSLGI